MATQHFKQDPHAGQMVPDTLATFWQIQHAINQLKRDLDEAEKRLVYYYQRQKDIEAELEVLRIRKQDSLDANELRRQAGAALAEAERLVGGE